ncbi:MAG: FliM/FliN family flagellar motor switch protein [Novosphingobium sp.]
MKPDHSFTAQRALANHCTELLGRSSAAQERTELLRAFSTDLCAALPARLQPLLIGGRMRATASEGEARTGASLAQSTGPCAANLAVRLAKVAAPVLLSIDLATALTLTDRMFGGDGAVPAQLPEMVPPSALLAMERIALAAVPALAAVIGCEEGAPHVSSHASLARLEPFSRGDYYLCWTISVEQDGLPAWTMQLAMHEAALLDRLQQGSGRRQVGAGGTADPASGPFGAIPLTLLAQLAELKLPLARLAALTPGTVIPIAPARSVTLAIGGQAIAQGTIGTLDERVALRLTRVH